MRKIIYTQIFSFFMVVCACAAESETSSKINDPELHSRFVDLLEKEGVAYRIADDGQVFYPTSEREKVSKIFRSVLGVSDPVYKGASVGYEQASEIASKLVEVRIPFEVLYQENTVIFKWPEHLNDKAIEIVTRVLSDHGV